MAPGGRVEEETSWDSEGWELRAYRRLWLLRRDPRIRALVESGCIRASSLDSLPSRAQELLRLLEERGLLVRAEGGRRLCFRDEFQLDAYGSSRRLRGFAPWVLIPPTRNPGEELRLAGAALRAGLRPSVGRGAESDLPFLGLLFPGSKVFLRPTGEVVTLKASPEDFTLVWMEDVSHAAIYFREPSGRLAARLIKVGKVEACQYCGVTSARGGCPHIDALRALRKSGAAAPSGGDVRAIRLEDGNIMVIHPDPWIGRGVVDPARRLCKTDRSMGCIHVKLAMKLMPEAFSEEE